MRELVIDLTPTCVNRTAIYHIALDTSAALAQRFDVMPQYRGIRMPQRNERPDAASVADTVFKDIHRWASQSAHQDEIDTHRAATIDHAPRVYFDPLYALYRPLQPQDVVFVLDMSTLTNPEWHHHTVAVAYERAFRKLMASSARVVCISDHCAAALRTSFAIPQDDIVTVPLYLRTFPSQDIAAPSVDLMPNRFFLFVGSLETRKNVIGLMRAFALSDLAAHGWKLAIAGGAGEGHAAIVEAAAELAGIEILGFVRDCELAWLYGNAAAFAYPSFLEGFGLPLLEAMAYGLPCLASITGASHEICSDTAVLVDPYQMRSIVDGLKALAEQTTKRDGAARRRIATLASRFTFKRYMDALMPLFDPVIV